MKNRKSDPDIFGLAIKDYFENGETEDIVVHSPEFDDDVIPVSYLFRAYREMPRLERYALDLCVGKVLDVGCGAGSHSLYLQNKSLDVHAIDTSRGGVETCLRRGIQNVRQMAFEDLSGERFDTILLLMNGTGIVGKMNRLDAFFEKLRELLNPGGQVLIDSSDLIYLFDADEDGGVWMDASEGYYGELIYRLSYKGETSESFNWLYLDFNSLSLAAEKNNFSSELLEEGAHFDYLARLTVKS